MTNVRMSLPRAPRAAAAVPGATDGSAWIGPMTEPRAASAAPDPALDPSNPFAAPSTLPYELPDYTAIREEHYEPALRAGMAEQRAQIEAIAANGEPPTVENTLEAFERSGRLLTRTMQAFYNQVSADATPGLEDLYERMSPEYAAHRDAIYMDARLHARLRTLADAADSGEIALEPDTAWLLRT